jgi:hypothetical protein
MVALGEQSNPLENPGAVPNVFSGNHLGMLGQIIRELPLPINVL